MLNRHFLTFKVKVTDYLRTHFTALINSYGPAAILCQNSGGHQTQKQESNAKFQRFLVEFLALKHKTQPEWNHRDFITNSEVYLVYNHQAEESIKWFDYKNIIISIVSLFYNKSDTFGEFA